MSVRSAIFALASAFAIAACSDNSPTGSAGPVASKLSRAIDAGATCTGVTMPVVDCQALVTLFNTTNGPGWVDKTNWETNPNPCTWAGIVCTDGDHGAVRRITLVTNGLTGPIPPALGNLTSLEYLALNWNDLSGPIPASLGTLPSLEDFQVFHNRLSGTIPAEFGSTPKLRWLQLNSNDLTGPIPAALGNAALLEYLRLDENNLSGTIPAAFGNLVALEEIILDGNALTGPIPAALGNLSNLDRLSIADNQISGEIPASLGGMAKLRLLFVQNNAITGQVPNVSQWPLLEHVRLEGNLLSGQVSVLAATAGENLEYGCTFAPGNPSLYVPDLPAYRAADANGDNTICGLPFATAEDIGGDAADDIDELVPATLNSGQANALKTKIENAISKAEKGQFSAAINQMQSFLTQLTDMVASGTLTPAQAAPFVDQANALIAIWMGMA